MKDPGGERFKAKNAPIEQPAASAVKKHSALPPSPSLHVKKAIDAQRAALEQIKRSDSSAREFDFTVQDFERVRALIYKHAGISLAPIKQDMVYSRLARRLRAKGFKRFADYLDALEANQDMAEWEAFVNALTTNLTSFFREAHHFDTLAEHLRKLDASREIRIWCCAASTGEEPYSIAMTACETFASHKPPVKIIASDLDTNVLAHGEKGIYALDRIERLQPERVQKFFLKGTGTQAGFARVRSELQNLIRFQRINLLDPAWDLRGPFDAIFCRNVMIYFDKPTQYKILAKFAPLLKPEGLLFAGHSENFMHAADLFKSLGRTVYARAEKAKS